MQNSQGVLQNMLVNNTKTGNQVLDYLLNFVILSFITYMFQNLKYVKKNFTYLYEKFFTCNNYEIIIEANSVVSNINSVTKTNKINYSKVFQAIIYYIKELKSNDIYTKRESDKPDQLFNMFIPDQYEPFLLSSEKNIQCVIKLTENNDTSKEHPDVQKKHSISIFSKDKNTTMADLEQFIDKCLVNHNIFIEIESIKEQYYFSFTNSEDNGTTLNFSEKIFKTNRKFNSVFFENKDKYIDNLKFFLENESWYEKKGIPYHYGILLHGTPGCGKTSIIKATLEYTKRHAIVIPLNRVKTCGELENIFFESEIKSKKIPTNRRIYIFEDIDCLGNNVVKDRELKDSESDLAKKNKSELDILFNLTDKVDFKKSINPEDELNLSCILNIFDGILETPGRIIILTSNYPEKIDKALLRPGRIDLNIELKKSSQINIFEILSSFYEVNISKVKEICGDNKFKDYILSPAEVMNICQNNVRCIDDAISQINYLCK